MFATGGLSAFSDKEYMDSLLGFLCSNVAFELIRSISPTLNFEVGHIASLPLFLNKNNRFNHQTDSLVNHTISISHQDWDNFETSWDFQTHPLLRYNTKHLSEAFTIW